jgi:hypothetical protein
LLDLHSSSSSPSSIYLLDCVVLLGVDAVQMEQRAHREEEHREEVSSGNEGDGGVQGQQDQQAGVRQVAGGGVDRHRYTQTRIQTKTRRHRYNY